MAEQHSPPGFTDRERKEEKTTPFGVNFNEKPSIIPGCPGMVYRYRLSVHLSSLVQYNGCLAFLHVRKAADLMKCAQ